MIIKVLGPGCSRCRKLTKKVSMIVKSHNIDAEIIKVEDFKEIMKYGIRSTPALVINEKLVCFMNIPSDNDLIKYINENS